jgi:hypothetical protein
VTGERIDLTDLGLDEVLLEGVDIHIERMDRGVIWLGITRSGKPDKRLALTISAQGKTLRATASENDLHV